MKRKDDIAPEPFEFPPRRAIAYLRVSTDKQDLGMEAQIRAIKAWCKANRARIVATFKEKGVSGAAPLHDRPQFLMATDAIKTEGASLFIVAKWDRLARDTMIFEMAQREVVKRGARCVSADGVANEDTPESELLRSIISAVATYERKLIAARTRAALEAKRKRGEYMGGSVPYGKRKQGKMLVDHPQEQEAIRRIKHLWGQELTYTEMLERMNDMKHVYRPPKTSRGYWTRGALSRLMKQLEYDGVVKPRRHTA